MELRENAIEWINGQNHIACTFSQKKLVNKVQKLAAKFPDEVKILAENPEGSIFAHLPLSYLKLGRPREMSEEQKRVAGERMNAARNKPNDSDV